MESSYLRRRVAKRLRACGPGNSKLDSQSSILNQTPQGFGQRTRV